MTGGTVLVTGATGAIGRFTVARLTAAGHRVLALVRDGGRRAGELAAWVSAHGGVAERLEVVSGDLGRDGLGLDKVGRAALGAVDHVIHLGAAVTFGMRHADAFEVNVRGTERLLDLAALMPRLRRFVQVTGYGIGLGTAGDGAYEVTKVEADRRASAIARARGLPLTRVHPGAVIGDAATGEVLARFGFGDLVDRIAAGRLPAIPGGPNHWMPLVTVDHVADFLARVALVTGGEYFVLDDASPPFGELVRTIAHHAGVVPPKRRVPMVLARLVARGTRDAALVEGLHFVTEARFDVVGADRAAAAGGLAKPALGPAIANSVRFLLAHPPARRAS